MSQILTDQTSNTTTSAETYASSITIHVWGVFHGAAVDIELSSDGGTDFDAIHTFTQAGVFNLNLEGSGFEWKAQVRGADTETSISLSAGGTA